MRAKRAFSSSARLARFARGLSWPSLAHLQMHLNVLREQASCFKIYECGQLDRESLGRTVGLVIVEVQFAQQLGEF